MDPTILPVLNDISTQQSKPTQKTMEKAQMLLDYKSTYPNTRVHYVARTM